MTTEAERALLRMGIVGNHGRLYQTSATFHAVVHALTDQIIDYVDKAAAASEAEQERLAEALKEALTAQPNLVLHVCQWERCPLPAPVHRDFGRVGAVIQRVFLCVPHARVWDDPSPHAVSLTTSDDGHVVLSLR